MKGDNMKKRDYGSIIEVIVVIVIVFLIFRYVVIPIRIDGSSMENNLHDNDIALINTVSVSEKNIHRFDVVVIYSDELNEMIIKRVIGLPGDTIEFKKDNLFINGKRMKQDFLNSDFVEGSKRKYNSQYFTNNFKVTVEEGRYFVMGDNRLRSTDSRDLGSFEIDDFVGVQGVVVFPFSDIQWLD